MVARLTRILLMLQAVVAAMIGLGLQRYFDDGKPMPTWVALLCGFAVVVCIRAAIAANNFRLAARFAEANCPVPIGRRRAVALYLNELAATLVSSSVNLPFGRLPSARIFVGDTIPVLLIHGYGCNSGYWRTLHRHLCRAQISHHAVDLEPVLADIDSYVPQIERAADALCVATGQARIIVIGHSMGGLVARAWIRQSGEAKLARLITLGTPHCGTCLAQFAPGLNSRQMQRGARNGYDGRNRSAADKPVTCSEWLTALHAVQSGSQLSLVSIYSHHDNIVAPAESAVVDGAVNLGFAGIGHVALASHPAILACLMEQIRKAADDERAVAAANLRSQRSQPATSIQENPSC